MATKPLKGINFPGLPDTFSVAPGGYGLGTSGAWVTDLNNAINSGFYCWTNVALNRPFDYGSLLVLRRQGAQADRITQIGFNAFMIGGGDDTNKAGAIVIRHCNYIENSWSEWEWVNPPMVPGEEYRTIERYNGNVVYVKAIDCGEWPSGISGKSITHNISGCRPFEATGRLTKAVYTVPYTSTNGAELTIGANSANINFFSGFEVTDPGNLIATLKYYKV